MKTYIKLGRSRKNYLSKPCFQPTPPLTLTEIQFSLFAQFSPFLFAEEEELTSGRSGDCKSLDRFCLQQLSTQKKETWN